MKWIKLQPAESRRYLLAVVAGLLLAASFPKLHVAGLAWIAPGLMLGAAVGMPGGAAFRIGYVAGLANFLASLYWLLLIPVTFAPIVGWLALAGYLSLYPAVWVWLCWKIYPARMNPDFKGAPGGELAESSRWGLSGLLAQFFNTTWLQRLGWSFCCAGLWVAGEIIVGHLFSGFPWNFLGVSQYQLLPLIQLSAWTGVYGVCFLVVWVSVGLLLAGLAIARGERSAWRWGGEFLVPVMVVAAVSGFGLQRVLSAPAPPARLKVLMIQPSIPQTVIWEPKDDAVRFAQLIELTEQALTNKPDVLIWPEAAVPSLFRWDTNQMYRGETVYETITSLVRRHQVWLIMGADDAVPRADAPEGADFYNSSFLVSPEGKLAATYRKQKLVIFGEYVPFSRWLPFLMDFSHVHGEFTPGKGPVTFTLPDLRIKTSVLICFEDVFPHLARRHVQRDTDFLVNLTNNGWFGKSAAQWQHAANAVFRAVENGRPLVRATNNGLTCWVDAYGGLHDVDYPGFKNIYQAGFKLASVPILAGQPGALTFYNRHGDWFGWSCVGLAGMVVLWAMATALKARRLPDTVKPQTR